VTQTPALKFAGVTASLKGMLMIPSNFQKVMVNWVICDQYLTCVIDIDFKWAADTSSTGCKLCLLSLQ
jgi:hypothetical protein